MRYLLLMAASALLLTGPAGAQEAQWSGARAVDVTLSNYAFEPRTIRLREGQPVILRLSNAGKGGHDFSAPDFFAAATIAFEDQGLIYRGGVEVGGGRAKAIRLTPRAGVYRLRCTHGLHSIMGMKGWIVVDPVSPLPAQNGRN